MTPVELAVLTVVVCWAVRRLLVDASFAVRGRTPPTLAARSARGASPGRYGARGYVADLWSDAWTDARARREAKRAGRSAPGTTGGPGDGSAGRTDARPGWRERMSTRWGQAWGRLADRWERRQSGSDRERGRGDQNTNQRPSASADDGDQAQGSGTQSTDPRADDTSDQRRQDTAGRTVVEARWVDGRWVADLTGSRSDRQQSGRATGARPHTNNGSRGDEGMSETTGLASAIAHAGQMRQANESAISGAEAYAASLQAGGVSGTAVEAVAHAMEAQQQAAAAWAQAESELTRHEQVREAYEANQGAGTREFVTNE